MARIAKIGCRVALGCLPLAALVVLAPKPHAHGQFNIFTALTGTVTGMGSSISQFNSDISAIRNLQKEVVYPEQDLDNIRSNGLGIVSSYRNFTNSLFGLNVSSAQLPTGQALERQLLSGYANTNPTAQFNTLFKGAFGGLPSTKQTTPVVMQAIDAGDASAQSAMQMSVMADSAAASSVQTANNIETQALNTSPGSGPQMGAQALVIELSSMAVEHKLLATQLRAEAAKLAYNGVGVKQGATATTNAIQGVFGGAK